MIEIGASELATWIRARGESTVRLLVGLVGPPGCGKSTLSAALSEELDAPVAPMDGYHLPNSVLDERGLRDVKGAPHTFDVEAFVAMLRALRDGQDAWLPDFDRSVDEPRANRLHIPGSAPVVLVEGNYLLVWPQVPELLDAVAYIDVGSDVRVQRLIDRHVEFGKTPEAAHRFVHESDERNAAIVESGRHRADLLIRT